MDAVRELPPGYQPRVTLDLTANRRLFMLLNAAGFFLMVLAGWLFYRAMAALRPAIESGFLSVESHSIADLFLFLGAVLLLTAVYVIAHEAAHGVFFWIFTRSLPVFAFHWTYAYAAAPGWYLPMPAFLMTTLAPLVLISLVGLAAAPLIPPGGLAALWFVLTMNASGAVGDLWVAAWLLRLGPDCLAQDRGSAVTLFTRGGPQGKR